MTGATERSATSTVRILWTDLPVLLVGSVPVAAAWALARALPDPVTALLAIGLLVVPSITVLAVGCQLLLADEHFGIGTLIRTLPVAYGRAVSVAVLPMITAGLTGVGFAAWQRSGSAVWLPSLVVGCLVSTVLILAAVVALPYRVRTGDRLAECWTVALYAASRNPVPVLGAAAAGVLAVSASAYLSFAVIILLPAPLALIWASAVRTATANSRRSLVSNENLEKGTR